MKHRTAKLNLVCVALLWTLSAPAMPAQQASAGTQPPLADAAQGAPATTPPATKEQLKADRKAQAKAEKKQAAKQQKKQQRKQQNKASNSAAAPKAICGDGTKVYESASRKTGKARKLTDACKGHGGVANYL
jgi:hypothetical protein